MSIAILTRNNTIIKKNGIDQTSKQTNYSLDEASFDIDGALFRFKINGQEFIHIDETNFHNIDKGSSRSGYCLRSAYENYKTHSYLLGTLITELLQEKNWFDSHFEPAIQGDVFTTTKLETSSLKTENYTKYYFLTEYKFKIKSLDINFFNEDEYPEANEITNNPALENYSFKLTTEYNRLNKPDGLFFSKNFGDKLATLNIKKDAKQILYKGIIRLCFEIYWAAKDNILDTLAIKSVDNIKSKVIEINIANGDDPNTLRAKINADLTLSKIDKIIAQLLLDWGLIDGFDVQVRELTPDFDGDEDYAGLYQPFTEYLTAVNNFSRTLLYYNENELFDPPNTNPSTWDNPTLTLQSNKRLKYIADVFPPSAISLIASFEDIKKIIEGYLTSVILSNSTQDYIIKLIESLAGNPVDGESFLKYLLEKNDGTRTKFEVLLFLFDKEYNGLIKSRTQVGNLIFPFGRREKFCKAILALWRKSNFNPNYNKGNLQYNPNFYFTDTKVQELGLKNEYGNANSLIEIGSIGYNEDHLGNEDVYKVINDTRLDYTITPLEGEIMTISMAFYDSVIFYENGEYIPEKSTSEHMSDKIPIVSKYHIFQPVTLIAYKEGEPLLTREPVIPAFLFYVSRDIENMKKIEEMVYFAAEVSLNIILFFALGGAGILEQIVYLRYITNIGRAVMAGSAVPAGDVVLVLKGLEGIFEVVSITGITASQYQTYLAQTASSNAERAYREKIARIYFYITLIAAGASIALRWKAHDLASEAVSNATYYNALPTNVKNFIGELAGYETKLVNSFRQRIEGKTEITSVFDNLTPVQRKMFSKEFSNLSDEGLQQLNYPNVVNNWKKLYLESIEDRAIVEVLKDNSKTDTIIDYYESYEIRQKLSSDTDQIRWLFLDEFKSATMTEKLEIKNTLKIKDWKRIRFDANLKDEFIIQSISNKIKLSEKFGSVEEKLFNLLKKKPYKISEYSNANAVGKKLLEDNKYFWLEHDLNLNQIGRVQKHIDKAYATILKRQKNNAEAWFTSPANKPKVMKFLTDAGSWENGKVFEIMSENYIKDHFLTSNTDIIIGPDIRFYLGNGNPLKTNSIQELDFIIINKSNNLVEHIGSVKMIDGFAFEKDRDKLCKLWFNLPNAGNDLSQYISGTLKLNYKEIQNVTSAKIIGTNLKTGGEFNELPSQFKLRVKPELQYNIDNNFKKVNLNSMGLTKDDIANSAYHSLLNKF
jgi:hypothetical protein